MRREDLVMVAVYYGQLSYQSISEERTVHVVDVVGKIMLLILSFILDMLKVKDRYYNEFTDIIPLTVCTCHT